VTWNIDGLKGKGQDSNFIDYIKKYDIIALLETWCSTPEEVEDLSRALPDYNITTKYGTKRSSKGRHSGGIVVLMKKHITQYLSCLEIDFQFGVSYLVDRKLTQIPIVLVFTYLPPQGSSAYTSDEQNGVIHLEHFINQVEIKHPNTGIIISGDLNARTKDLPDYIINDSTDYLPLPTNYIEDNFSTPRNTQDKHGEVNSHGKELLKMCCTHSMHMLNGRTPGDTAGHLTCFTANGHSTVDYTIASTLLFPLIIRYEIGDVDDYTHLPQTVTILATDFRDPQKPQTGIDDLENMRLREESKKKARYIWSENSLDVMLGSDQLRIFEEHLNCNCVDDALNSLTSLVQEACLEKVVKGKTVQCCKDWWDEEMNALKYQKYKSLRLLRSEPSESTLMKYRNIRKMYKSKIREKRELDKQKLRNTVEKCKTSSDFWKIIRVRSGKKQCINEISREEWQVYFNELLNSRGNVDENFEKDIKEYMEWHDGNCDRCTSQVRGENENVLDNVLDSEITTMEIENALQTLCNRKSPGLDGITNEILKNASVVMVPLLCKLFNKILDTGCFPIEWGNALLVPIHKKGDHNEPSNYRGIALLSCVSKVFTKILNVRITQWAEDNNKMFDVQAGFTKGKGTIDQIFIFQSIVSKYLSRKGGRFYSVFIDFSKAFDSVPHLHLFYSLVQEGLHGKIFRVLRDMYDKMRTCVQSSDGSIGELFPCMTGTRQGCMLSPFLFIFYLNELIKQTNVNECKGVFVSECHPNVSMLLYADDLVLLGDNIGHVQKLLDNLSEFCSKWGLSVNMEKSNFMVFRNGGIVKNNEKVYFKGEKIRLISYYKYLGVVISSRLSWSPAQKTLAMQAEKSMNFIRKFNYECDFSFETSNKLFDMCTMPVILYGSEIWGTDVHDSIEDVLLKHCRIQLGVGSKAPSPSLLGECGRNCMYVFCHLRSIKYWLKLLMLPDDSLLKSCYTMLFIHSNAGRLNWAGEIKRILYSYGFGYVWEQQWVANSVSFLDEFRTRLLDCDKQLWSIRMNTLPKLRTLLLYKTELKQEPYLYLYIPHRLRSAFAKFRIGHHELEIERGRHRNVPVNERYCKLCQSEKILCVEDEYHVLLKCPSYDDLRSIYLELNNSPINMNTFIEIMSSTDPHVVVNLASFVSNMFKLRNNLLQAL